jgi:hypothetical protein
VTIDAAREENPAVKSISLALALIIVLVLVLPGCDGGDASLPYIGPIDGDQPADGDVTPTPPDDGGTPTPPPPPGDGDQGDDLQPPSPPIF